MTCPEIEDGSLRQDNTLLHPGFSVSPDRKRSSEVRRKRERENRKSEKTKINKKLPIKTKNHQKIIYKVARVEIKMSMQKSSFFNKIFFNHI